MDPEVNEMLAILAEISRKQSELIELDRQISQRKLDQAVYGLKGQIFSGSMADEAFRSQDAAGDELNPLLTQRDQLDAEIKELQDRLPTPATV